MPSTRLVLLAGFGGLLAIMALSGVDALRVLRQIRREDDQIRREFLFRNHVLNDIRSQLYLSGTFVRDYLLDPDAARAEVHRAGLEEVRGEMNSALESYAKQSTPAEMPPFEALKVDLARYWETLRPALRWTPEERRIRGYTFLSEEVFPRRMAMLATASKIAAVNEKQLNAGNDRVVLLLSTFQTRLAAVLVTTLALGLGMAAFSTRRILTLEARASAQYREVVEARRHLQSLSARLVQTQETERRALSRELHDEVGQSLSAVLVELRNLSSGLAARSEEQSRGQVETIKGLVENTVRVVRNMALLLRPSMLDDLGLVPALRWQAREVSKRTSMDCERGYGTRLGRLSGRVQDLRLSSGPGSVAQLLPPFARRRRSDPGPPGAGAAVPHDSGRRTGVRCAAVQGDGPARNRGTGDRPRRQVRGAFRARERNHSGGGIAFRR